jgi:hypothetical protein
MTDRLRPLPLLLAAIAALLLAGLALAIATEHAQAVKCKPGQCPEEPPIEEPPAEDPQPIPGPRQHRVLVVNVGWGDGSREFDAPLVGALDRSEANYINGRVNDWFAKSAPPGAFPGWTATAGGSYRIDPNPPFSCASRDELHTFFASQVLQAEQKLEAAGIDYEHYNLLALVNSRRICDSGVWTGNRVLLAERAATVHEFGHYLGLEGHAEALRCKDADGNLVPLSKTCQVSEYGDPFDAMGNTGTLSYNAVFAKQLGWLNGQFINFRAPETGTWTLTPFIADNYDEQFGVRAMRVQDGSTTFWIEYRVPQGIDADNTTLDGDPISPLSRGGYGSGVFIRREAAGRYGPVSQLLDMTPIHTIGTPSLELGQTWANPLGEVTITLDRLGPGGATVTIGNQRTATVPDLTGLDPERALEVVRAAGLWSNGWKLTLDPNCKKLGVVANQLPLPGTKVFPNSEVQLWVGEKDPEIPCP